MAEIPYEDQRRFMEEMILRFERAFQGVARVLDRQTESLDRLNIRIGESIEEQRAHRREMREEYEAHRGTLLAILDRLDLIDPRQGPPHPSQG